MSTDEIELLDKRTRSKIPLKSVSITTEIIDFVAQVVFTQTFFNSETNPIEAMYNFFGNYRIN